MKRALRRAAWADLGDMGAQIDPKRLHVSKVQLKQKPHEYAKPGKYARITCDLGCPASLRAGWLPEAIKHAMADCDLVVNGVLIKFVKSPDPAHIGDLFRQMRLRPVHYYFSDDATLALPVVVDGVTTIRWFNVDISGCDASCSEFVADMLESCVPAEEAEHMRCLIKQLTLPCALGYGPGRMLFRPKKIFEYSGSVLTTALNNCAAVATAAWTAEKWPTPDFADADRVLRDLLAESGWECTVESCEEFEDVQFLKQSPARRVDGGWGSVLNIGVLLRAVGQCRFDLPGRGSLEERASAHTSAVVRGMLPGGRHPVIDAYCRKFDVGSGTVEAYYGFPQTGVGPRFDLASVCRRYRVSCADASVFLDCLEHAGFGDLIDTHFSRTVLARDYGY